MFQDGKYVVKSWWDMAIKETNFDVGILRRGKVRDVYDLGEHLLLVTTDRISAFDVILPTPIPDKGKILTMMSRFWFDFFSEDIKHHLVTSYSSTIVWMYPELKKYEDILKNRSMLVRKYKVLPIECIVRGYITGSGWKSYKRTGMISGIKLPSGLKESQRLEPPLFTPTTKAEQGHDQEITFEDVVLMIGRELAEKIRDISIKLYSKARDYALSRGIIIADTKFEFGLDEDENIYLVDEVLTPDSSRFWYVEDYEEGRSQKSFDKQFVRDYLNSLDWDKAPPGPEVPADVVENTRGRYIQIYNHLTGEDLF